MSRKGYSGSITNFKEYFAVSVPPEKRDLDLEAFAI